VRLSATWSRKFKTTRNGSLAGSVSNNLLRRRPDPSLALSATNKCGAVQPRPAEGARRPTKTKSRRDRRRGTEGLRYDEDLVPEPAFRRHPWQNL